MPKSYSHGLSRTHTCMYDLHFEEVDRNKRKLIKLETSCKNNYIFYTNPETKSTCGKGLNLSWTVDLLKGHCCPHEIDSQDSHD